jgi:signal peptidase I
MLARLAAGVLVVLAGAGALWLARRRLTAVTVRGWSMAPTYADGDRVLVRRIRAGRIRPGQVVVLDYPAADGTYPDRRPGGRAVDRIWMIKRLAAVGGDPVPPCLLPAHHTADGRVPPGTVVVLSDNSGRWQDSRQLGYLPGDRLLGAVIRVLSA